MNVIHYVELASTKVQKTFLRAGFEPATYGSLFVIANYSPPLYQLSYRRLHMPHPVKLLIYLASVTGGWLLGLQVTGQLGFRGVVVITSA